MLAQVKIHPNKHLLSPENWVDAHANYLNHFATKRISDEEAAKDIVQDTFLAGLKSKSFYKGEASERTWLTSILKYKIIDHYRKINSKKRKAEIHIDDFFKTYNQQNSGESRFMDIETEKDFNLMENNELKKIIALSMSKLPKKQYLAIKLKAFDQYSTEAICDELQISRTYLCVLIGKAKMTLMAHLNKEWFYD